MKQQPRMAPNAASHNEAETPRIVDAVAYLDQCRQAGRRFAIVTGNHGADVALALRRFAADLPAGTRLARTPAPTDSSHAFLESILAQFGFDPFDATADDLLRLLTVVLRQGGSHMESVVIIVEDAQAFGPRVLETIRDLARNAQDWRSSLLFVLSGSVGLNRVLDSIGMASVAEFTRVRFDLDAPAAAAAHDIPTARPVPARTGSLLLSRDQRQIGRIGLDRDRVLIGRSEHSDVCLASRFVSRQHALLLRNPDGDWLIDLKSTNGTIVNSELIERRRLVPGDVISIGNFQLRYEDEGPAREAALSSSTESDQLAGETVVMRSLQALHQPPPGRAPSPRTEDTAPTAAA